VNHFAFAKHFVSEWLMKSLFVKRFDSVIHFAIAKHFEFLKGFVSLFVSYFLFVMTFDPVTGSEIAKYFVSLLAMGSA
jgi:hypothetical protein